jgi:hypothetical protein
MESEPKEILLVGDQVTWSFTPPGGYGYVQNISGKITSIRQRVQIEIFKKTGERVRRWVKPENLTLTGFAYCSACGNLYTAGELSAGKNYKRVCPVCHDLGM